MGEVRIVTVIRTQKRATGTILVARTQTGKVRNYWPSLARNAEYLGPETHPPRLHADNGEESTVGKIMLKRKSVKIQMKSLLIQLSGETTGAVRKS